MKKLLAFLICLFVIIPLWAQNSSVKYLPLFDKTPNAAIGGDSDDFYDDVTLEEAARLCVGCGYLSFDYNKETKNAGFRKETTQSSDGLKTDNAYDHYSYLGGLQPFFFTKNIDHIKATIKTNDLEQNVDVSILILNPYFYIPQTGPRFISTEGYGKKRFASVYHIKLRLIHSDGNTEDIDLFYCPRCDLYYMGPNFDRGLYSDIDHSRIPFYTGKEQPGSDKNNLVVVNGSDSDKITYKFSKLDDSQTSLIETSIGLNSKNGKEQYKKWKSLNIQNYSFTLTIGMSHWYFATIKLVVSNSIVIDYEIIEQYGNGMGKEKIILTVDDLFEEYINSEKYNPVYTTITYDKKLRVPLKYSYDIKLMTDEEVNWHITEFKILE